MLGQETSQTAGHSQDLGLSLDTSKQSCIAHSCHSRASPGSCGFGNLWDFLFCWNLRLILNWSMRDPIGGILNPREQAWTWISAKTKEQGLVSGLFMPLSPSAFPFPLTPNPKKDLPFHNYPSHFSRAVFPAFP